MSDWIEWDGSNGGYPETLDTRVDVRLNSGKTVTDFSVCFWYSGGDEYSNWRKEGNSYDIVAYRVVNDV